MTDSFENSFYRALAEYESKMMAPYDKGGALYNGEDDEEYEEDWGDYSEDDYDYSKARIESEKIGITSLKHIQNIISEVENER